MSIPFAAAEPAATEPTSCPPAADPHPAVFIDKDSALVQAAPDNLDPTRMQFRPRALSALRLLGGAGYRLIVVTHQPGVARGQLGLDALQRLRRAMGRRIQRAGVVLEGLYACPHDPASASEPACSCRKPAPGLLLTAARAHGLDLSRSWMVGGGHDDVQAGLRAGCQSVLLDGGRRPRRPAPTSVGAHARASDLYDAARWIVAAQPCINTPPDVAPPDDDLARGWPETPGLAPVTSPCVTSAFRA